MVTLKPLNFYQQGASAGLQQSLTSQAPGCIDCENLDIFSDQHSIKATSWSEEYADDGVVDQDESGEFVLKKDGVVYKTSTGEAMTNPNNVEQKTGTIHYANTESPVKIQYGIPKKLVVTREPYNNKERSTITVWTDRGRYDYYHHPAEIRKFEVAPINSITTDVTKNAIYTNKDVYDIKFKTYNGNAYGGVRINSMVFAGIVRVKFDIAIDSGWVKIRKITEGVHNYVVSKRTREAVWQGYNSEKTISGEELITASTTKYIDFTAAITGSALRMEVECEHPESVRISIESVFLLENRGFYQPEEAKFISQEGSFYKITPHRVEGYRNIDTYNRTYKLRQREVLADAGYSTSSDLEIVDVVGIDEKMLVFTNANDYAKIGDVYTVDEANSLSSYQGMKRISVVKSDSLIYILAENRGVRGLYVYYGSELRKVVGDTKISGKLRKGRFRFGEIMEEWAGNILIGCEDGRIYMWGTGESGSSGSFVLKIPEGAKLEKIGSTLGGKLGVWYKDANDTTKCRVMTHWQEEYESKAPRYEQQWSITYPVQIASHLIEKEPLKVELSAYFPSKNTWIDLRLGVNGEHYWHCEGNLTSGLKAGDRYIITGCNEGAELEFERKTPKGLIFVLRGERPYNLSMTTEELTLKKVGGQGPATLKVKKRGHETYIGRVQGDGNGEIRTAFVNLTNQLQLPRAHQFWLKAEGGSGNQYETPQLYTVSLVCEQLSRG